MTAVRGLLTLGVTLAVLAIAATAAAAPSVEFKARPTPIAGFPQSGNMLGAGATLVSEFRIEGHEASARFPPQLTHLDLYLPAGIELHAAGVPTCPPATLEPGGKGPRACPVGSAAGMTTGEDFVDFGNEIVPEPTTIETFHAPGGGLLFFAFAHEPVLLESLSKAHFESSSGLYGRELVADVPLVEAGPGREDAAVRDLTLAIGSARVRNATTTYYLTLPSTCPRGGLSFKAELTFAALEGRAEQTTSAVWKAPCPSASPYATGGPSPLPGTEGVVIAPSNVVCVSKRDFRIHIVHIPHLVYRLVTVELNGKPVKVLRGKRQSAQIDLRGLPKGRYVARIGVVTTTGRLITGTRTYHTCAAHAIRPKRPPRL